ncbi:hypothetical protein C8R46DRAFT_180377 [Mycena filopes]|nr:hypothetical protein C8R46DRAFT_180377 [Mycena filopes]
MGLSKGCCCVNVVPGETSHKREAEKKLFRFGVRARRGQGRRRRPSTRNSNWGLVLSKIRSAVGVSTGPITRLTCTCIFRPVPTAEVDPRVIGREVTLECGVVFEETKARRARTSGRALFATDMPLGGIEIIRACACLRPYPCPCSEARRTVSPEPCWNGGRAEVRSRATGMPPSMAMGLVARSSNASVSDAPENDSTQTLGQQRRTFKPSGATMGVLCV